jgi:SAM-dependent methyltransferase
VNWPDIAAAYDLAAADYADLFGAELAGKPFDTDLLDWFAAELAGGGPVWDVGCGSAGHVTRYLADRGVQAAGVDLSPGVVVVARQRQPGLEFRVADMRALPAADGSLAGIVAFYSVIHLPRTQIPVALAEFRRALAPGGRLLIAMHGGSGEIISEQAFGHPAPIYATLVTMAELTAAARGAGLVVDYQHERAPYAGEHPTPRLYLGARR